MNTDNLGVIFEIVDVHQYVYWESKCDQRCDFTVLTPAFCMAVFRLWFHDGISKHHQQYKTDFIRLEKVTAVQTD